MANTVSRSLSDETLNRIIQIESAGNPSAKAPTSSAAGLGQFILGTWNATVKKHRPDLIKNGVAPSRVGGDTTGLQVEMLARFTEDNARSLGAGYQDGDLYLAHFLGLGAAKPVLRADQSAAVEPIVGAAAVKANRSILAGKTCGQVRAWAQQSMVSRWDRAGRPDWVKKYAGTPITMPVLPAPKPTPKGPTGGEATAGGAVVVGGGAVVVAASDGWGWIEWSIAGLALLAVCAAALFGWRWWKARKAKQAESDEPKIEGDTVWIGDQLPASLPPSLQSSELSSEQLSVARLALSSAALQAAPSPQPSARKQPRKRSAKPSPKTRKRRTSSRASKNSAARKSSPKRKPKSRARNSKG